MSFKPAPSLNAPASSSTVKISAIDSTLRMVANTMKMMWNPEIKAYNDFTMGTWCFLIEHPSGRKVLYDLGCRKDWENLPPSLGLRDLVEKGMVTELSVQKNLADILKDGGVNLEDIEAIIWSHWHFDHTGDPSTFPSRTKVIFGKGFKSDFLPGYPTDPNGHVLESDFKDREIQEIDFNDTEILIGRFRAFDYFGDGSFFILDSPGHAVGHINALARTHPSPCAAFIHLGGDSAHSLGEFRPTEYLPLPDSIKPSPVPRIRPTVCPGHFFAPVLREESTTKPILEFQDPFTGPDGDIRFGLIYDKQALRDTVRKDEELDASDDVFTIIAHDWSLKGVLDEWPKDLNSWREQGWKGNTRWKFLEVFGDACVEHSRL